MAGFRGNSNATEIGLQMNYWSEALSEAQRTHYHKTEQEYNDIMCKVAEFISKEKGSVLEHGSNVLVLQSQTGAPPVSILSNLVTPVSQGSNGNQASCLFSLQTPKPQAVPTLQAVSSQPLVIQGASVSTGPRVTRPPPGQPVTCKTSQGTIQLVVDPRLVIVGTSLSNQQVPANQATHPAPVPQTPVVQLPAPVPSPAPAQPAPVHPTVPKIRPIASSRPCIKTSTVTTPSSQAKGSLSSATTSVAASVSTTVTAQKGLKSKAIPSLTNTVHPSSSAANRPTENNSIGGLCAGNPNKKNVQEDVKNNASGPDSREVAFNKLSGKTFPSLVVLARPHLKTRDMTHPKINQERSQLDSKVKCVLMYLATKFTEWLIQQGLIRSDQYCNVHSDIDGPLKLKLGLYSDVSKFPFSGGYVWASECCPQRYVSVFSGSIFEGAPHPPSVLLKLMYHWCCQTNVQNVIQWVRVDNFYVKNFFTLMRSVCISAVHEKHEKLGGPSKKVEVGVISLGTTSQDGNQRQVKVEVLGVMDAESKMVRLRAVEPLQEGERNYKRRFVKILEPLKQWVHPDSIIQTDYTVDKGTLLSMGFSQVFQVTIPDPPSSTCKVGNQNIMEYLRRIVPRMFQNTLSLLSRQIIQQFLDELVWRERWGPTAAQAFDTLMSHLASQTKLDAGESLIVKLGKIAANPFRNWEYEYWKTDGMVQIEPCQPPPPPQPPVQVPAPSTTSTTDTTLVKMKANAKCSRVVECYPSIAVTKQYKFKLDEDTENRVKQAVQSVENGSTIRDAVETFKVPRTVLRERCKAILKAKVAASQAVFLEEEEEDIRDHLITLYNWGYPFGRTDVRLAVKQYLDVLGRTELTFKDNFPGEMWIERYLSRHPTIRHMLSSNIPSRANFIEPDSVKQYIFCLSSVVQDVPPENILNFMEIGLTGDPLKSMTMELRELRHPPGKRRCKSAASVMLACTALGRVLPSYVIFEGRPLNISHGHFPGRYYATKSGWFDETAFEYWIETVLLPWADELSGKKVVIGDSLAQLFTLKTVSLCLDKDITFLCMPCNVSGVLSPLDVALCDKLRIQWRTVTRAWATRHSDKFISSEEFPIHIYELLTTTIGEEMQKLVGKAFQIVGISPFSSKNALLALQNAGVSLTETEDQQKQGDSKKRKRIYIGADDRPLNKKLAKDSSSNEVDDGYEEEVSAMEQALKSVSNLISLDSYYYGTKLPNRELLDSEHKLNDLNAKCPLCYTQVSDNLNLMRHLLGHSERPSVEELVSTFVCRYCAFICPSREEHTKHVQKVHTGLESRDNNCLICAVKFESRAKLVLHMQKTHTKMELPYICTICCYRSSEQYKLVDHFYEVHSKGEKIQCPYCLKCVAISSMGKKIQANILFFMHHVKKHQTENSSRTCDKCALGFVHKGILSHHLTKDHLSCVGEDKIVPYIGTEVMMTVPEVKKYVEQEASSDLLGPQFTLTKINNLEPSVRCMECNSRLNGESHFKDCMSCLQCVFATYCGAAMKRHTILFHGKSRPVNQLESAIMPLQEEMFCMCGFQTRDGNILAHHLVKCMKVRAFTSAASAKAAAIGAQQSNSYLSQIDSSDGKKECRKVSVKKTGYQVKQDSKPKKGHPLSTPDSLTLAKKSFVDCSKRLSDSEFELKRDRPSSRASNSSNSSAKRKHSVMDAGFDMDKPNKIEEGEAKILSTNHKEQFQNETVINTGPSEISCDVEDF